MKPPIKKFNRYELKVSYQEKVQILRFLDGDISSRELVKSLGYSHQGAINFIGQICRQWFQQNHLCYYETTAKKVSLPPPKTILHEN